MPRNYIDGKKISLVKTDIAGFDIKFENGEEKKNLMPKLLFPLTDPENYVAFIDEEGEEYGILTAMKDLNKESYKNLAECIEEYYLIPKILSINDIFDKFGIIKFDVKTDKGDITFNIKHRHHDIKLAHDGTYRMLIRDSNDNRYEIPDIRKLDKHSAHLLFRYT